MTDLFIFSCFGTSFGSVLVGRIWTFLGDCLNRDEDFRILSGKEGRRVGFRRMGGLGRLPEVRAFF